MAFNKITSTVRQFNMILVKYVFNLIYNCVTLNFIYNCLFLNGKEC